MTLLDVDVPHAMTIWSTNATTEAIHAEVNSFFLNDVFAFKQPNFPHVLHKLFSSPQLLMQRTLQQGTPTSLTFFISLFFLLPYWRVPDFSFATWKLKLRDFRLSAQNTVYTLKLSTTHKKIRRKRGEMDSLIDGGDLLSDVMPELSDTLYVLLTFEKKKTPTHRNINQKRRSQFLPREPEIFSHENR